MARLCILALVLSLVTQASIATELTIESSQTQIGLLELYTSEGCSSCPPADRWLSKLKAHDGLWVRFVPVGLHVDYWDYIGWKDRFASPHYSRRQRDYARHNNVSTVYTPGFIYNGNEWRSWFGKPSSNFPIGGRPGVLRVSITSDDVEIEFAPLESRSEKYHAYLALLGFGISTDVQAGENSGRQLNHDFVVLGLEQGQLQSRENQYTGTMRLPQSRVAAQHYAVAAWVSEPERPAPLQAVGGWLTEAL